jgi:hypothetical protein
MAAAIWTDLYLNNTPNQWLQMPLSVAEAGDQHGNRAGGKIARSVQIKYILLFLSNYNKTTIYQPQQNNNISTTTKHIS